MTKTVETLVDDIEALLGDLARGVPAKISDEEVAAFGAGIGAALVKMLKSRTKTSRGAAGEKKLYMSEIGKPCTRQLWYEYHQPEKGEPFQPHTLVKFLIGDITESVMLLLAKLAGHKVEGEQERVEIAVGDWVVSGKKDALIDGAVVDVKSASKFSFQKFQEGLDDDNDAFGYRTQLDSYAYVEKAEKAGFLVMNKETGKMLYAPHEIKHDDLPFHIDGLGKMLEKTEPPPRTFDDVPEGKSGNRKLGTNCSYCPHKATCWPGLRGFVYARGPVWLTQVAKTPDVPEIPMEAPVEDFAA